MLNLDLNKIQDIYVREVFKQIIAGVETGGSDEFKNLTTAQRDAISSPRNGMVIYNTSIPALQIYIAGWKTFTVS